MDERKIIERGRQSLNFIEQLQNQIQLCREALSDDEIPLTPRVQALEALLWAKLKNDEEYRKTMQKLDECFKEETKVFNSTEENNRTGKDLVEYHSHKRNKAREQFKAIMVFIEKKNLMPIGEENE